MRQNRDEDDLLSGEHIRRLNHRYMLKQRRIVEDIACACDALAEHQHVAAYAATNIAGELQAALLEYEIVLADKGRHAFFDKRRKRLRKQRLFGLPDPARLAAPKSNPYAMEILTEVLQALSVVAANLRIRTHPATEAVMGADAVDRRFVRRLESAIHALEEDMALLGWAPPSNP